MTRALKINVNVKVLVGIMRRHVRYPVSCMYLLVAEVSSKKIADIKSVERKLNKLKRKT